MALSQEFTAFLNDDGEPLPKRLRIAKNAFVAPDLPVQHKEGGIISWFCETLARSADPEVWHCFHDCLLSDHMKQLTRSELQQSALKEVKKTIKKALKSNIPLDLKKVVIKCGIAVIENAMFQQYFRHGFKKYCDFVCSLLKEIDDKELLLSLFDKGVVFNRNLVPDQGLRHVLNHLNDLCSVIVKFDDVVVFNEFSNIIQRAALPHHADELNSYLNNVFENSYSSPPEYLINSLLNAYNEETAVVTFKLIFNSFASIFKKSFSNIYKFFIFIINIIGFDVTGAYKTEIPFYELTYDVHKSVQIVSELVGILRTHDVDLNAVVNAVTFTNCIESMIKSVLVIKEVHVFKIVYDLITINPIVVETLLSDIVIHSALFKKRDQLRPAYSDLMIIIFQTFAKLHRIQKFVSKLLRSLVEAFGTVTDKEKSSFTFRGTVDVIEPEEVIIEDILTQEFLNVFNDGVLNLGGVHIIGITRTLIFHLNEEIEKSNDGKSHILYVQIISELLSNFLSHIKIIDSTISGATIDKFAVEMESLKSTLMMFEKSLLEKEHNPTLVLSFLQAYFTWGRLFLCMSYYVPNYEEMVGQIVKDSGPSNFKNYLILKDWSLVEQRIKNFGEKPCKEMLLKVLLLRVHFAYVFNEEVDYSAITRCLSHNVEILWKAALKDRFIVNNIISKMTGSEVIKIAEYLIDNILDNDDVLKHDYVFENSALSRSILFICLKKIKDAFKSKHKPRSLTNKVLLDINPDTFIASDLNLTNLFDDIETDIDVKVNSVNLLVALNAFENVPVCYYPQRIQVLVFSTILALAVDLKDRNQPEITKKCETILEGILQSPNAPNIVVFIKSDTLIKLLTENVSNYKDLLAIVFQKALKNEESASALKPGVKYLEYSLDSDDCLNAAVQMLQCIEKCRKSEKLSDRNKTVLKKYNAKLTKRIMERVTEQIKDSYIEAFALVLKKYLVSDKHGQLTRLTEKLNEYMELAKSTAKNTSSSCPFLLFEVAFKHTTRLSLSPQVFSDVWNICKNRRTENAKESEVTALIFQHVSENDFTIIGEDLLGITVNAVKTTNLAEFKRNLKIWSDMSSTSLNLTKKTQWKEYVTKILLETTEILKTHSDSHEVILSFLNILIKNNQVQLSSIMIDIVLISINSVVNSNSMFSLCTQVLNSLISYRKDQIADRLPAYLIQVRLLLKDLCVQSNADTVKTDEIENLTHCAHQLERLVKQLCTLLRKDFIRIAPYLIATFLNHQETIPICSNVKVHLDNCLYLLINLCDDHGVSFLLRTLSTGSRELFKTAFDNYKKYHRFIGKV